MVDSDLLEHAETDDPTTATVSVDASDRADHDVEPKLFGKFCEHLGNNVYGGMEAQVLFDPTFGEYHFAADPPRQSGGHGGEHDSEAVEAAVRARDRPLSFPEETDPDALLSAYRDGLALGWQPLGDVVASPDTGPNGDRAQRLDLAADGDGVFQETRLPAHRTREYEFRLRVRAAEPATARLAVGRGGAALAEATVDVTEEWTVHEGDLGLLEIDDPDAVFEVSLTGDRPTSLVVDRVLLYPGDHVGYADPEVVALLRESALPLLRWPGGNFASGYHWRDGVGPVDDRPVRDNPAWTGLEPNLFGTDEFLAFCDAVGCEPMICVNAGDGTPAEAARWVEYCNGSTDTAMGALRAEHGHPEPYDVTHWEVGNELYGEWQVHWTTPAGNADRYERFREAMLDADPSIQLTACGSVTNEDRPWNEVLLDRCGETVRAVSSHPLAGGPVDGDTDPDELFHGFMGYADQLGEQYAALEGAMLDAGVDDPKLDVTELQLFARFREDANDGPDGPVAGDDASDHHDGGLAPETMPTPATVSEALYDACVRHELVRLGPFARMLTHSATVNHGGGLRKDGERVWANPCHYGRALGAGQAGETPVPVTLECAAISTETSFREIDPVDGVPAVDAMATVGDGVVVTVVNRASREEPVAVRVDVEGVDVADAGELTTLAGETMYDQNTRGEPERVAPETTTLAVEDGRATVDLPPYAMAQVRIPVE